MPEPTVLFAICGCLYYLRCTGNNADQRLGGVVSFERSSACQEHRYAPPSTALDMPVDKGSRERICRNCGGVYDEDYCPTCEELD